MNHQTSSQRRSALQRYAIFVRGVAGARDFSDFAMKVIPVLCRLGLAWPVAWMLQRTIEPINHTPPDGQRILAIQKAVFNEDIRQVFGGSVEFAVFGLKRAQVKAMALAFLPKAICDDATYVTDDPAAESAKLKYRAFCGRVWQHLASMGGYKAVITGNWCYWAERELAAAMESQNAPFLVLHKEGIKPPERSKMLRDIFRRTRGRFGGRRVFVYQESERDHQIEGQIADAGQIRVVGMPRMDRWHELRRAVAQGKSSGHSERPTLLFLAFIENNFLPSYSGVESDLAWRELASGCAEAIFAVARARPAADIIVRPRVQEVSEVAAIFARCGELPQNVRIVAEGEISPLLLAADVVCGHNTTVLFEGLALGKPVVMPAFGEALDSRYHGYIVDPGPSVESAASVQDLTDRLVKHLDDRTTPPPEELAPSTQQSLAFWTGNPDGLSVQRVLAAMRAELTDTVRVQKSQLHIEKAMSS